MQARQQLLYRGTFTVLERLSSVYGGVHGREESVGLAIFRFRVRFPGASVNFGMFSLAHSFGANTGVVPREQNRERLV